MASGKVPDGDAAAERKQWAFFIFLAAFAVRIIYLLTIKSSPLFDYLTLDPLYYHQLAQQIAKGQIVGNEVFFKAPLYPYFLGLIYAIFGDSTLTPRVIQSLFGALSCSLVYLIARRFYSNRVAVTAGFIMAFYGTLIFYDNELLLPAITLFLNLLSLWLLLRYEDDRSFKHLFLSGLFLGLSSIARPDVLIFVPVVIFWLYKLFNLTTRAWIKPSLIFLLGLVILIIPVAIRNYVIGKEMVVFGTYGGLNFAIGNNAVSDGRTAVLPGTSPEFLQGYYDAVKIASQQTGKVLSPGQVGDFWFKQGLNFVFSHPLNWVWLEFRKLVYMVSGYEISNNKHIYFFAGRGGILKFLLWDKLLSFPLGLLLPLAVLAPLTKRVGRKKQLLIIGYTVTMTIAVILFFVTARFRLAIVPMIAIWASAGFWGLLQLYRDEEYHKFYKWATVLGIGLLLSNGLSFIPGLSPRMTSDYEGYLYSGAAYYEKGEYAKAKDDFYTAARLNPRSPRAFYDLANACVQLGEDSVAIDYYKKSARIDPTYELAKQELANVYQRNKKISELNDLVVTEMKADNKSSWVYHTYAYLHTMLKKYDLAAEIYEEAFQADTTDYDAIFLKGECYLNEDMRMEAAQEFERYLRYVPNSVEAHGNLGQVYARQNKFPQALQQFNMCVDAQPTNPAGFFNLASVYLQMRDFDKAEEMLNRVGLLSLDFPGQKELQNMINNERRAAKEKKP